MTKKTYAGDLTPQQSWDLLSENPKAQLVDVRTDAEFAYVGNPDLSSLTKEVAQVYWQVFPAMDVNSDFVAKISETITDKEIPLLLICRSGVRSLYAAEALTAAGYSECYNVAGGFEGDKDPQGHRGGINGWKVAGLPWKQG